jgi:head-tail adaptor
MAFMSKIKAGDFNMQFKVKQPGYSQNNFGEKIASYSTVATVWGNKNVSSLRNINEKFEGDKLQSYGEFYIVVRYDSSWVGTLDADWILEDDDNGQVYEIISYIVDPRKEFIEFRTKMDTTTIS